jgi:hypothetical protein
MPTNRPFAYNPNQTPIDGSELIGYLSYNKPTSEYQETGLTWWGGPDEDARYVIGGVVPSNTQPTPDPNIPLASVGFWGGTFGNGFVNLANQVLGSTHTDPVVAAQDLNTSGYWHNYPIPVLRLDAAEYLGSGDWIDSVASRNFVLYNSPGWTSGDGGYFEFTSASSQYAECNSSLPSMSEFTTIVWFRWDGSNAGSPATILTEIFTGGPINYFVGDLIGNFAQGGYFNGNFQVSPVFALNLDWYQIVVSCDANQVVRIYLNNTLISTTNTTGAPPSSSGNGIRLMRRWDDPDYVGGRLSIVNIYDRALTATEINSNWYENKDRFGL